MSSSQSIPAPASENLSEVCPTCHNHHQQQQQQHNHQRYQHHHHHDDDVQTERRCSVSYISSYSSQHHHMSRGLIVILVTCVCLIGMCSAAPVVDGDVRHVVAPFTRCARITCDLRTQYCDEKIQNCASCEDDCNPARLQGNLNAQESCKRKCQWYYAYKAEYQMWKETLTTPITLPVQLESLQVDSEPVNIASPWAIAVILVTLVSCLLLLCLSNIIAWVFVYGQYNKKPLRRCTKAAQDQNAHCRDNDNVDLIQGRKMTDMSLKASHKCPRGGDRIYVPSVNGDSLSRDNSFQPLVTAS